MSRQPQNQIMLSIPPRIFIGPRINQAIYEKLQGHMRFFIRVATLMLVRADIKERSSLLKDVRGSILMRWFLHRGRRRRILGRHLLMNI